MRWLVLAMGLVEIIISMIVMMMWLHGVLVQLHGSFGVVVVLRGGGSVI